MLGWQTPWTAAKYSLVSIADISSSKAFGRFEGKRCKEGVLVLRM
jgi:hypothetical protein